MNKLRLIKGKLPKKVEIGDWSEEKLQALLSFGVLFMEVKTYKGKDQHMFEVNPTKMSLAKKCIDEPFYDEFFQRIETPNSGLVTFRNRLMMMLRTALSWLKSNPHAISEELRVMMETNERYKWALDPFKATKTEIGGDVIKVDNKEVTDPGRSNVDPRQSNLMLPVAQYNNGLLKLTSLFKEMVNGIKRSDLKGMDVERKLKLAIPLAQVLAKAFQNQKVRPTVLAQININSNNREDLEKAVMDYAESQNQDD